MINPINTWAVMGTTQGDELQNKCSWIVKIFTNEKDAYTYRDLCNDFANSRGFHSSYPKYLNITHFATLENPLDPDFLNYLDIGGAYYFVQGPVPLNTRLEVYREVIAERI